MPGASRPTLEDVAARAGVGRGTASRALSGSTGVRESTRSHVLAVAQDLGYRPNKAARSLVTRRTGMITLVLGESGDRMFTDPFFGEVVRGLGLVLRRHGHQLVLLPVEADHDAADTMDYLSDGHTDAVVLVSSHAGSDLGRELAGRGVAVVRIGRPLDEDGLPWVDVDNIAGAELATRHLLEQGCRAPAHVTGTLDMHPGWARRQGYRKALQSATTEMIPHEIGGDFSWDSGRSAATEIMSRRPDTDGIFAASDLAAAGVLAGLAELGIAVPAQVRVIGFDDSLVCRTSTPRLTTIRQPIIDLGAQAAERVLGLMGSPTIRAQGVGLLPVELVRRDST